MIAVRFEVRPAPGWEERYLDLAKALRRDLERIDNFVWDQRFRA